MEKRANATVKHNPLPILSAPGGELDLWFFSRAGELRAAWKMLNVLGDGEQRQGR